MVQQVLALLASWRAFEVSHVTRVCFHRLIVHGITERSVPIAIASCAVLGAAMGTFDYGGKSLQGSIETREEQRKRFFKHPPPTAPAHSGESA